MAKISTIIGYGVTAENVPGVHELVITERRVMAEVIEAGRRFVSGDKVINDISADNQVSVLADAYASQHLFAIQFIEWAGATWTVEEVRIQRPRLLLRLGGVYNGPRAEPAPDPEA